MRSIRSFSSFGGWMNPSSIGCVGSSGVPSLNNECYWFGRTSVTEVKDEEIVHMHKENRKKAQRDGFLLFEIEV